LDESLPKWWRTTLNRRHPHLLVWRVGDPGAPPLGTSDPLILEWCETNNFLLLTDNRRTMPQHLANRLAHGRHMPGIFILNSGTDIKQVADDLSLIEGASFPGEFQDQVRHLPLT
jgi:hypothetical protein